MRARLVGSRIETSHINKQRVRLNMPNGHDSNKYVCAPGWQCADQRAQGCVLCNVPQTRFSTHFPLARAHKVFLLAFAQWLRAASLFSSREPVDDDYVIVVQSEHALPNTQHEKHRASTSAYNLCTHETKSNPSGVWDIYATNVRKELIHNTL